MSTNPVAEAQALINTFMGYKSPTMQDLNTMTSGIISILNEKSLSSDQQQEIVSMLTSVLDSNSFFQSESYEYATEELSQMSVAMNKKFFATISPIFEESSTISKTLASTISNIIKTKSESTTSLSSSDYQALWEEISAALTAAGVSSSVIQNEWNATLKLYFNLNYSNYMSATLSEDTINNWTSSFSSTLSSTYGLGLDLSTITTMMTTFFSDNGLTSKSGMSTSQFISFCNDTLALLSSYLSQDDIDEIRQSMGSYISDNFLTSNTYSDSMNLSAAESLSSSVSANFSVTNLPFTPSLAASYQTSILSSITSAYTFSSSQQSSIQDTINSFFKSNPTSKGLTPNQANELWNSVLSQIVTVLEATSTTNIPEQAKAIYTSFLNNLQTYILKNITDILNAKTFIHDDWQEFLFANPSTGKESYTGNYLSDWAKEFMSKVGANLTTTQSTVLNSCLEDMMNANNNVSNGVSGYNFIQIGCELLLWLSLFLDQSEINTVATNMQEFLLTFVYVYNYVESVDEGLEIFGIVIGIIAIIAATVLIVIFTAGLAAGVYPWVMTIVEFLTSLISTIVGETLAAGVVSASSVALANTIKELTAETSFSYAIGVASVLGFLTFGGFENLG